MAMHFAEETFIQVLSTMKNILFGGQNMLAACPTLPGITLVSDNSVFQCVLEAVEESLGEDRTEKHFLAFLHAVFEQVRTRSGQSGAPEPTLQSDPLIH